MYKPLGDKVLLRKNKIDDSDQYETKSGIIVQHKSTRHKGRSSLGTVEALGDSYVNEHGSKVNLKDMFQVGDKVLYYHPAAIELEDDLILVRAIDIDCKIDISDEEMKGFRLR